MSLVVIIESLNDHWLNVTLTDDEVELCKL